MKRSGSARGSRAGCGGLAATNFFAEINILPRSSRHLAYAEVKKVSLLSLFLISVHWSLATLFAAEPLAKGIQDNSFFVEEAYNQEPGVVQHILNVPIFFTRGDKEILPSFTQEWPVFSQTHQFSYTVPCMFQEDQNGLEDMRLNYRLQAFSGKRRHTGLRAALFSCHSNWRR